MKQPEIQGKPHPSEERLEIRSPLAEHGRKTVGTTQVGKKSAQMFNKLLKAECELAFGYKNHQETQTRSRGHIHSQVLCDPIPGPPKKDWEQVGEQRDASSMVQAWKGEASAAAEKATKPTSPDSLTE